LFPDSDKNTPRREAHVVDDGLEDVIYSQLDGRVGNLINAVDEENGFPGASELAQQRCDVMRHTQNMGVRRPPFRVNAAILQNENRAIPRAFFRNILQQRRFAGAGLTVELNKPRVR